MTRIVALTALLFVVSPGANAQSGGPPLGLVGRQPPERVEQIIDAVRENIHELLLSNGSKVPRETAAERAAPLLPRDVELRAVDAGLHSGVAQWCQVDWQPHFSVMMAWERGGRRWTDKQTAYIGALHGAAQGSIVSRVSALSCGPGKMRDDISAQIRLRIQQYRAATP